jgi:acetyltransferase-like isoleucine patch superfamily enzyme
MRDLIFENFRKLAARSPRLDAKYPPGFYIGLAFRCSLVKTAWYSARFRGVVVVGRGSRLRVHRTAKIVMSSKSVLAIGMAHDTPLGATLRMHPRSQLRIDGRVQFMRACTVTVGYDATLNIGAGTFFNDGSAVWCYSPETTIGPGCAISWGVRIIDTDFHKLVRDGDESLHTPVRIGRDCWIGTNALVMKGAQLGDGSVVAAGAVVTSEVPPRTLVAGIPARVIRESVTWIL